MDQESKHCNAKTLNGLILMNDKGLNPSKPEACIFGLKILKLENTIVMQKSIA